MVENRLINDTGGHARGYRAIPRPQEQIQHVEITEADMKGTTEAFLQKFEASIPPLSYAFSGGGKSTDREQHFINEMLKVIRKNPHSGTLQDFIEATAGERISFRDDLNNRLCELQAFADQERMPEFNEKTLSGSFKGLIAALDGKMSKVVADERVEEGSPQVEDPQKVAVVRQIH